MTRIAIQGELGSNSHMAALAMFGADAPIAVVACRLAAEVFERVVSGVVDAAVLPIENSLHGSVADHYDLLLQYQDDIRIVRESLAHIRHNVIAAPGVRLEDIRQVISHPVALSQCRRWLASSGKEAVPFYDTAGSVKHIMASGLTDTAGIAPELAAREYGAAVLVSGIEDHAENYTRFYLLDRHKELRVPGANKVSIIFSVDHRPGTLLAALEEFRLAGLNLTRIESRPVPGSPWEYIFFVDARFETEPQLEAALAGLRRHSRMLNELGRYPGA